MGIIAYEVSAEDEKLLLHHFPAKYPTVRANHITISGGNADSSLPPPAHVEIIGYADDGNGVEALVVKVNGEEFRETDGRRYHITMSYDPEKMAPAEFDIEPDPVKKKSKPYGGVHSNGLIEQRGYREVSLPFTLTMEAKFYEGPQILPGTRLTEPGLK